MDTDNVSKVAERLKLSSGETRKLRTTVSLAEAQGERAIMAVLTGMRKGEAITAKANEALSNHVDYPQRIDECPICYAHMQPVTLASARSAMFCPIHNVVMPTNE